MCCISIGRVCGQHGYSQSMELAGVFLGMACAVEQYGSTAVGFHVAVYTDVATSVSW